MHTLHLQTQDSRYATPEELAEAAIKPYELPPSYANRLMAHQAQTIAALRAGAAPIVINTATTGDGKSFAGQHVLFTGERRGLIMYPTNELAKDQERSLGKLKAEWPNGSIQQLRASVITAAQLDEIQHEVQNAQRTEALDLLLGYADLVLTNPDIFHLMLQFRYQQAGAAADFILGAVARKFNLFTFDEFHIFNTPQVLSALIAMLLLMENTRRTDADPRFLFLSATPQTMLTELARAANIPFTVVHGDYVHGSPQPDADRRRILQPATLHLHERGDGLEAWIETHLDHVIDFFARNRPARGVILANSVATAYRVHQRLIEPCRQAGIDLGEPNTGLTPSADRKIEADLFVATSTVDVGVDFKINFLVFESIDAATHLQRLGRLGRHAQAADGEPFGAYAAHGLLFAWVLDKIKAEFTDQAEISRAAYGEVIASAFPKPQEFAAYRQQYAGIQAGNVLAQLEQKPIRNQYAEVRERLYGRYAALFPAHLLKRHTLKDWITQTPHIFKEASAFRGTSPFTALVRNTLGGGEPILPYNLITLLRYGKLRSLAWEEAYRHAGERAALLEKSEPLSAYHLVGWLDQKPRRLSILLDEPTSGWDSGDFETVVEQHNFKFMIDGPHIPDLFTLNRTLAARTLVAILVRNEDPESLRMRYRLGLQLELFAFRSQDDATRGTVAFGRDALLLESLIHYRKSKSDDPMFG
ncbi:MAG: type I-D CRISPR-associated helicase Cas3' [Chloroflexi bacterium]|nr:type I-D CRISPR-associated helicase Cas3' [Chloroflexota bacterium]